MDRRIYALFISILTLTSQYLLVNGDRNSENASKRAFTRDCDSGYSVTCFKLDIVSFLEKMAETQEYNILPGVTVVRDSNTSDSKTAEVVADLTRSFPNDAEKRLDGFLFTKLSNYLQSHTLRLRLLDAQAVEEARSAFTGRKGKIGKKGGLEAILAAAMMMKGTLMAVALGGLALLAGKALMTGLMALMLSAIIGLKALTSGGHKQTTYEIIAKPSYSHTSSHSSSHEDHHGGGGGHGGYGGGGGHSGYGRSLNFALPEHLTKQ